MLTLLGAKTAAASAARGEHFRFQHLRFHSPLLAVMAIALSGCMRATTHITTEDPADPAAKIAHLGYRSTVAPYASLRPATSAPWRERNDAVAPQPKQER